MQLKQLEEESALVCDCAVPAEQLAQIDAPTLLWKEPVEHIAQPSDPGFEVNIPAAHLTHVIAPEVDRYEPDEQLEHSRDPADEKAPAEHKAQFAKPVSD